MPAAHLPHHLNCKWFHGLIDRRISKNALQVPEIVIWKHAPIGTTSLSSEDSDHPRGYEVAGNLIKQVAEVTEKLGDLQEKMKKLKEVPNSAPKNVTNALFVGSTAELQKMLKGKTNE